VHAPGLRQVFLGSVQRAAARPEPHGRLVAVPFDRPQFVDAFRHDVHAGATTLPGSPGVREFKQFSVDLALRACDGTVVVDGMVVVDARAVVVSARRKRSIIAPAILPAVSGRHLALIVCICHRSHAQGAVGALIPRMNVKEGYHLMTRDVSRATFWSSL
jgi:hypothetical protein